MPNKNETNIPPFFFYFQFLSFFFRSSFFLQDYISFIFLLDFFFVVFSFGVVVFLLLTRVTSSRLLTPPLRVKESSRKICLLACHWICNSWASFLFNRSEISGFINHAFSSCDESSNGCWLIGGLTAGWVFYNILNL